MSFLHHRKNQILNRQFQKYSMDTNLSSHLHLVQTKVSFATIVRLLIIIVKAIIVIIIETDFNKRDYRQKIEERGGKIIDDFKVGNFSSILV